MTLAQLLRSLSDPERDLIMGRAPGVDHVVHRAVLDRVIQHGGDVDSEAQEFWCPYEALLGKHWPQEGHEREYAACMGIVLHNIETGRDRRHDLTDIIEQHYSSIQSLPDDLRAVIDSLIERILKKTDRRGASNPLRVPQRGIEARWLHRASPEHRGLEFRASR